VDSDQAFTEIISRAREISSRSVIDSAGTPDAPRLVEDAIDQRKPADRVVELFKKLAK
jgi:hypothetical protein